MTPFSKTPVRNHQRPLSMTLRTGGSWHTSNYARGVKFGTQVKSDISTQLNSTQFISTQLKSIHLNSTQLHLTKFNSTQINLTQSDTIQLNSISTHQPHPNLGFGCALYTTSEKICHFMWLSQGFRPRTSLDLFGTWFNSPTTPWPQLRLRTVLYLREKLSLVWLSLCVRVIGFELHWTYLEQDGTYLVWLLGKAGLCLRNKSLK